MDSNRTISLYGFRETDETVFCTLLSLLSFKTTATWEVVEDERCDVTVVDVDSNQGLSLADNMEKNGRKVIRFGQYSALNAETMCLNKPLRAADILKCLNRINQDGVAEEKTPTNVASIVTESTENTDVETVTAYRLRRWPCSRILGNYPGASRLCALLMKEPLTVDQIVERSDISPELVWDFVSACAQQNFVTELEIDRSTTQTIEKEAQASSGLFAKLRLKFGSRG